MKVITKITLLAILVVVCTGIARESNKTCSEKKAVNQPIDVRLIAAASGGNTGV